MNFDDYTKLYIKAENAHALYGAWAYGRKAIRELLEEVSRKDTHSRGQIIASHLIKICTDIESYCKILRDDMKKADDALSTEDAKDLRRTPEFEADFYLWRRGDYDEADYSLMPVECDIRAGERIWPEEKFDFVKLGMGI